MTEAVQAPLIQHEEADQRALPPVQLDKFEGPLDVLLHLIRSQELDVFDIPLALITQQYLDILEAQEQLDLEIAGDYLVMASTLMQLKSRMLLPRPEIDDEGNAIDPRAELAAQLIAYEQYRMLAEELDERPRLGRDVFVRSIFPESDAVERPLPEGDLDALLLAFRAVLKRVGGEVRHQIFSETMSVRERMGTVLERLSKGGMQLDELLAGEPGREALVTTVLAILELWRQQTITVIQSENYGSITLLPKEEMQ
ncbi:condensin subunit ScpA [Mariprofundus ferrinatatus]|uniref:Segregation and condensation protein A n=1 Tax=Mariprofundus ferrinatatus TaxID=1921087 RepID=A0A2K8L347_9PROT|nr:segregation/condensation protein A [Mariprofundus ferrinatatus]ATX81697.1 condensin subunit ScpA [Mariprofundus ferrinatatus]